MNSNELLIWLLFFHLKNKYLREYNKDVYSHEEIRHIFRLEYTKQQNKDVYSHEEIRHIFRLEYTKQQKFIMPNISNKV
jgi:hypothetical protein